MAAVLEIPMKMKMMIRMTTMVQILHDPSQNQAHHLARQTIPIAVVRLENKRPHVENARRKSTRFQTMMMTI